MLLLAMSGFSCARPGQAADVPPANKTLDQPAENQDSPEFAEVVLAGGCFWCTEAVFEQLKGVESVVSGYAGGEANTATYEAVSAGRTEHAEVIRIRYDPTQISYTDLLQVFFAAAHDPTQVNRQGPDVGTQYRSAIFYADEQQKAVAEAYIQQINEAEVFSKPIATTLEPLDAFYEAERYHQDFVVNNPRQGYVVAQALPKVKKVREQFSDRVE